MVVNSSGLYYFNLFLLQSIYLQRIHLLFIAAVKIFVPAYETIDYTPF